MRRFLFGAMLAVAALGVHANDAVSLAIGDASVRISVPDGYLRASEKAPAIFSTSSAAMPPTIRLVETLYDVNDLKRMLVGQTGGSNPYLQVQALRDAEALEFSADDWKALQPVFAKQMGAVDLDAGTQAMQSGMGKRMGEASGASVDVRFGEIGKPQVYSQEGGVVRFAIRLPVSTNINGQQAQMVLNCAGAVLILNKKLLMLNAYVREDENGDNARKIREFLEQAVLQAQALNAASTGGGAGEQGSGS